MSLYTPSSTIRRLILEAEDLTLSPDAGAQEAQQFSDQAAATPNDVMNDMTAAQPAAAPGLQGSALTMPSVAQPATTLKKTVINRDIILSQLAELKSVITNYEKKFDGDDLTPETANVHISSLLGTLVFHAERFNAFMESDGGAEPEAPAEMPAAPEMPAPEEQAPVEPPPTEGLPPAGPEAGLEAPPEQPQV